MPRQSIHPSIHPSILPSAPSISHPISKHHPHSAPSVSPREPSRAIRIRPSSARAPLARSTTSQRMRKGPSHTHTHTHTHAYTHHVFAASAAKGTLPSSASLSSLPHHLLTISRRQGSKYSVIRAALTTSSVSFDSSPLRRRPHRDGHVSQCVCSCVHLSVYIYVYVLPVCTPVCACGW
ncbi:hypothetical protein CCHR01_09860 [Colletotrichum chrysophilum]|uniref:Uncharacterized protein n=1 Tax=Colletotrichum chrysophilum TaxID=1836956 RepID=A0AAD9EGF4_9PEZI|nr:hypothetical protein CCHR01_09860 [Colletotrichum chrysophilum]